MSNDIAFLIILTIWLLRGGGKNLCLLIISYYMLYEISHAAFVHNPQIYFISQIFTDICILMLCLLLAYKQSRDYLPVIGYSLVVFSSLLFEGVRLIDEVAKSYSFINAYDIRQEFSHILDITFAVLGSGRNGFITDTGLRIRGK